ncbi:hypothetical protein M8C21_009095, partial [Ambrosia artemisiifolia]
IHIPKINYITDERVQKSWIPKPSILCKSNHFQFIYSVTVLLETLAAASGIGEMDRISHLPDFIIHHILSFFDTSNGPPAELVRMSVLSKNWFQLTASFPILDFDIRNFASRESFFKYVEYTTSRFCHQNVPAHAFKLITSVREPAELDIVNRCLELVLQKGVGELVIDLSDPLEFQYESATYRLPNTLLSVSMLTCCPGLKRFCVPRHQNLQNVRISYKTLVESIDIESPNLSRLWVADWVQRGAPQMNLASCKKLTHVSYFGHPLPNSNGFTDFLSNFPFIENLVLVTQYNSNNLKLSSNSLRTLVLRSNCDFEEIEFRTPNLVSFSYPLNHTLLWPVVWHSTHLKPCMQIYPDRCIDTPWFKKLRRFLDKENGFKVFNLFIHAIYSQKLLVLENLKAIGLPPYELEHVELQLEPHEESSDHTAFVEAVLWCCRPRSLTLRSSFPTTDFEEQSDLVKFAYMKLLEQEDQGHTKVHIVSPSSSKAQKHFKGLMCEGKAISFIKEEGILSVRTKILRIASED